MASTVLITRELPKSVLARMAEFCDYRIGVVEGSISRQDLLEGVANVEGLICQLTDKIDQQVIDAGKSLKVIANVAVGYNNIDLDAATKRGIVVTNTPDVLTDATADLTWALILSVTRRVVEADAFLRAGLFTGWDFEMLLGTGLTGKMLGIIGYGRIGHAVARRAAGFGLNIQYCNREDIAFRDDQKYRSLFKSRQPVNVPFNQSAHHDGQVARHVPFHDLIETSDIVSIHVPLAPTTRHLIDRNVLRRMKPGAFLINTARGPIVDEQALVEALESGWIAGAGLDVFEEEPIVAPGLLPLRNVVLLPHIGSATHETRTAMARLAAENVLDVLGGRMPRNRVN